MSAVSPLYSPTDIVSSAAQSPLAMQNETRRSIPREANAEVGGGSERPASTGLRRSKIVTMNKKIFRRPSSN